MVEVSSFGDGGVDGRFDHGGGLFAGCRFAGYGTGGQFFVELGFAEVRDVVVGWLADAVRKCQYWLWFRI